MQPRARASVSLAPVRANLVVRPGPLRPSGSSQSTSAGGNGSLRTCGPRVRRAQLVRCARNADSSELSLRRSNSLLCTRNNHNLRIDWNNLDKKEFMKTVSSLDIHDLFKEVVSDTVQYSDGYKQWDILEYVLQRKDRRIFVGGQGFVLFVRRSQHSSSLAMKVCLHSECKTRMKRYQTKADLQIVAQTKSRFISSLLVYYMTDKFFVSVMYKAKYSSLKVIKREIRSFPPKYVKYYAACVMDAIKCLHSINICHKDIKADNVLIDHRGVPQLADFGLAVESKAGHETYSANRRVTTMQYYPPECLVMGGRVNDYKVDSWLFGFFMSELSIPSNSHMWTKFNGSTSSSWRFEVCSACRLPDVDSSLEQLLRAALQRDPTCRPIARELGRMRYFDLASRSMLSLEQAPDELQIRLLLEARPGLIK